MALFMCIYRSVNMHQCIKVDNMNVLFIQHGVFTFGIVKFINSLKRIQTSPNIACYYKYSTFTFKTCPHKDFSG